MGEDRKKIIITGGTGMVGSRVVELLSNNFDFFQLNRSMGVNIADLESFKNIPEVDADALLHFAGKTDVDGCEEEKDLQQESEAWKVNVNGTKNIVEFCQSRGLKMIHISTDFVFDGRKIEGEYYTEEDIPNPVNFYAETKYEAEKAVQNSGIEYIILRIAYPYRKEFALKKDFVRALLERMKSGKEVNAIKDQVICPTFIDDIATVINELIALNESGIYHAVGDLPITPFDACTTIAEAAHLDTGLIHSTTREEYFHGKAKRPFNLYLKNDKIESLGIVMKSFEEGLQEILKK